MEKRFWNGLENRWKRKSADPIYCILDNTTCFDDTNCLWNLSKFTGNESIIHSLDRSDWFDGIHTSFLYLGMFGTSFAWHREDRNLCSINRLHYGAPKVWYSISFEYAKKLEKALQAEIEKLSNNVRKKLNVNCNLVVRHKVLHVPPSFLRENGIPFGKVINFLKKINFSFLKIKIPCELKLVYLTFFLEIDCSKPW